MMRNTFSRMGDTTRSQVARLLSTFVPTSYQTAPGGTPNLVLPQINSNMATLKETMQEAQHELATKQLQKVLERNQRKILEIFSQDPLAGVSDQQQVEARKKLEEEVLLLRKLYLERLPDTRSKQEKRAMKKLLVDVNEPFTAPTAAIAAKEAREAKQTEQAQLRAAGTERREIGQELKKKSKHGYKQKILQKEANKRILQFWREHPFEARINGIDDLISEAEDFEQEEIEYQAYKDKVGEGKVSLMDSTAKILEDKANGTKHSTAIAVQMAEENKKKEEELIQQGKTARARDTKKKKSAQAAAVEEKKEEATKQKSAAVKKEEAMKQKIAAVEVKKEEEMKQKSAKVAAVEEKKEEETKQKSAAVEVKKEEEMKKKSAAVEVKKEEGAKKKKSAQAPAVEVKKEEDTKQKSVAVEMKKEEEKKKKKSAQAPAVEVKKEKETKQKSAKVAVAARKGGKEMSVASMKEEEERRREQERKNASADAGDMVAEVVDTGKADSPAPSPTTTTTRGTSAFVTLHPHPFVKETWQQEQKKETEQEQKTGKKKEKESETEKEQTKGADEIRGSWTRHLTGEKLEEPMQQQPGQVPLHKMTQAVLEKVEAMEPIPSSSFFNPRSQEASGPATPNTTDPPTGLGIGLFEEGGIDAKQLAIMEGSSVAG